METEFKNLGLSESNIEKVVTDFGEVSPVTTLSIMVNKKQEKLDELRAAINDELNLKLTYLHHSNEVRINPGLKDVMGLTKNPTEKQVQAYIEETFKDDFDALKIAEENTKLIKRQLELIDNRISLEKYAIQLELRK